LNLWLAWVCIDEIAVPESERKFSPISKAGQHNDINFDNTGCLAKR
jgi:hypothetical protein